MAYFSDKGGGMGGDFGGGDWSRVIQVLIRVKHGDIGTIKMKIAQNPSCP